MKHLLTCALLALATAVVVPAAIAQVSPGTRAYAPENLRTLPYNDQVRVISLEYSEQSRGRRIPDDQLRFYIDQVNRSNWTFSRIKQDIAQSMAGGGAGPRPPVGGGAGAGNIRCESDNNRARTCRTPWQGGSRLVRQLSDTPCVAGRSWQSQNGQVYVTGGCRGEFAQGAQVQPPIGGGAGVGNIRCESDNYRPRTCRTPWQGGSRLVRQLSDSPCIAGRSWQSQNGQVHVTDGCHGEFAQAAQIQPPRPGQGGYSVSCSSNDKRTQTCAWDSRHGRPYVQRQLSSIACRENGTWGYQGNSIWVKDGCRALFGAR
jgi:hypothetical protein